MSDKIRLNKFLSASGYCSRRKADEYIAAGKVKVNGVVANMGMKVSDEDEVKVKEKVVKRELPFKLVAFYKPRGFACTMHNGDESGIFRNFKLDMDLKYIGRLDKDSEGLLLLSNDGELCNEISKARNQHEKEYVVTVNRTVTDDFLKGMAGGVKIHDSNKDLWVVTKPCKVKKRNDKSFSIILTQGYNRQIRKMCEVFGYKVDKLKRIRVINIEIGELKPGEIRNVTEEELIELKNRIAQDRGSEMKKEDRIKELVSILNDAGKAYYQQDMEIMSNLEYDKLYDELVSLEKETGIVLANSPTVNVGYEVVSELPKQRHPSPMLSLDKTKEAAVLVNWLGTHEGVLSWKLDGLTVVLTYENGELKNAVTRGNGEVGEVITNNARTFVNLPGKIPFKGNLVIRGEAVIKYSDFNRMNEELAESEEKYKNPRNLCSGSVRQLNNEITAKRHVNFYAFSMVADVLNEAQIKEYGFDNTMTGRFAWLAAQGFDVVEHYLVDRDTIEKQVMDFAERIADHDIPSDGLVLSFNDIAYGRSLGTTAKFPRDSIAFKWADELAETRLLEVEWSPSRTGLINPVAVFEPVELEGTTVSRASLHNVSILRALHLGLNDKITVYKANMIIPQVADNLTGSDNLQIPELCPACGKETTLQDENGVQVLYCKNPDCPAKQIKGFAHFVSRNAMNIDGLSEATLEKLIDQGLVHTLPDLYHLDEHKDVIVNMEGFGEKSFEKLIGSVEASRRVSMAKFIYSLGITGIGLANAKVIVAHFDGDFDKIINADADELTAIDGIGEVLAKAFYDYFHDVERMELVNRLLAEVTLEREEKSDSQPLKGKVFVITGSVEQFLNRDELKEYIEKLGGKVTGSVSKKTDYLINNDVTSNSSKNKKANELGIQILSEDDFLKLAEG